MLEAAPRLESASIEVAVIRRTSTADRWRTSTGLSSALEAPCSAASGSGAGWRCGTRRTETLLRLRWTAAAQRSPPHSQAGGSFRLLAVGSQFDLKLLEVEAERSASISLLCVCECPAERLLQAVTDQDHSVSELQALRVLSFIAGRCCLMLNSEWLLQLQWQQVEAELQILTCCNIQMIDSNTSTAVHHSVSNITDGRLLATVDLPVYLSSVPTEDDLTSSSSSPTFSSSSSSFCRLQVSADLSTVVAVSESHTAVGVDLNHYFRDQDSVSSSSCSAAALGSTFSVDRSWEARLASMYSRAQQAPPTTSSSCSWSSSLPHLELHQAPSSHSRVPRGGTTVTFSVPESSAPSLLTVSEFSALLTFVSPGNRQTTVASWDLESGSVSYHQAEEEAAPLQLCGEKQHRLLLKNSGIFQVLFSVSQQDLLGRLMLFGSAATVDAVCHLNSWGRCSIPIHALQAGLKNRQLDTVDFYLKSKENVLNLSTGFSAADQPLTSTHSLTESVQELCPALDLLCSAVRDSHSEAQSRQFSEQLLNITVNFVNTQIRSVLTNTYHEDSGVRSCVDVLDRYVTELRSYMKKFPWPPGGDTSSTGSNAAAAQEKEQEDEWAELPTEEVVRLSILTNQIPRAQAVLRGRASRSSVCRL
ncbi:hypothetical protein INR49_022720 [Caranx melampygus]|nr:hypothetical protein INR49_022720 [Caranx melampygus]